MIRLPDIARTLFRRAVSRPRQHAAMLSLTQLEPRENPAIPTGLSDVQLVNLWGPYPPHGYTETHTVTRDETNTVTVDQSGSGSSGTFTIDVVGSADSSDSFDAVGSGGTVSVIGSGTGSNEFSYHLVLSGDYSDGVFTITCETYTESGSYNSSQTTTQTNSDPDYTPSYQWDESGSGNYDLSWSAAIDSGVLAYTSYSYTSTDTGHWHMHYSYSDGGYSRATAL